VFNEKMDQIQWEMLKTLRRKRAVAPGRCEHVYHLTSTRATIDVLGFLPSSLSPLFRGTKSSIPIENNVDDRGHLVRYRPSINGTAGEVMLQRSQPKLSNLE